MNRMTTKKRLWQQLMDMGIAREDTVAIHTSLRAVGPVEGRGEGFLDALREYLEEGLLVIPTHTWASVNRDHPVFDVRHSVPCIGTLPCIAAFHPDGVRSLHATHSVTVFGKRAAEYVAYDEEVCTPTPAHGCFGRLYEEKAKILLVGVGQERDTFLHVSEEILEVPDRLTPESFRYESSMRPDGNIYERFISIITRSVRISQRILSSLMHRWQSAVRSGKDSWERLM